MHEKGVMNEECSHPKMVLAQSLLSSSVMYNGRKDILNGRSVVLCEDDQNSQIHPR